MTRIDEGGLHNRPTPIKRIQVAEVKPNSPKPSPDEVPDEVFQAQIDCLDEVPDEVPDEVFQAQRDFAIDCLGEIFNFPANTNDEDFLIAAYVLSRSNIDFSSILLESNKSTELELAIAYLSGNIDYDDTYTKPVRLALRANIGLQPDATGKVVCSKIRDQFNSLSFVQVEEAVLYALKLPNARLKILLYEMAELNRRAFDPELIERMLTDI